MKFFQETNIISLLVNNSNVVLKGIAMKSARVVISIILLGLLAVGCGGCFVAVVGAGAAAGVGYVRGDLEAVLDADPADVYEASLEAMDDLELPIISKEKNALEAKIVSRTTEDKKVQIIIKRTETNITKLSIRIGVFGNEVQSRLIYDKIKANL